MIQIRGRPATWVDRFVLCRMLRTVVPIAEDTTEMTHLRVGRS